MPEVIRGFGGAAPSEQKPGGQAGGTPAAASGDQPAAGGTPASPGQQPAAGGTPAQPANFEQWLAGQDQTARNLYAAHTQGLRSALDAERAQRGEFEKQLRDLAAKAEKGSEAQKSLEQLAAQVQQMERQGRIYDQAHRAGVSNLRLAYLVATTDNLLNRDGSLDVQALKEAYPELFGGAAAPAQAGAAGGAARSSPANPATGPKAIGEQVDAALDAKARRRWHMS